MTTGAGVTPQAGMLTGGQLALTGFLYQLLASLQRGMTVAVEAASFEGLVLTAPS